MLVRSRCQLIVLAERTDSASSAEVAGETEGAGYRIHLLPGRDRSAGRYTIVADGLARVLCQKLVDALGDRHRPGSYEERRRDTKPVNDGPYHAGPP
jgi:hypothetical protein